MSWETLVRAELKDADFSSTFSSSARRLAEGLDDPVIVRRILAEAFRDLMLDSKWDALTYWDNVPEALEIVYCCAALALQQQATNDGAQDSLLRRAMDTAAIFVQRPRLRKAIVAERDTPWFKDEIILLEREKPQPRIVGDVSVADWPAFSLSFPPEEYGDRYVPVEQDGRQRMVPLSRVATNIDLPRSYLAQHRLFDQIPGLRRYFGRFRLSERDDPVVCAWIGAKSVTPRHADPRHNTVVQIFGVKRWHFFDQREQPHSIVHLHPGQVLFVPKLWTHAVESVGPHPAFALSYWSSSSSS